jgi:hypothetical protein
MDKVKLTKLGLTKERMDVGDGRPDALFWYQLILPMCDPKQSGVPGDGRKAFYTEVEWMSNCYAMGQLRMGMLHGHAFLPTNAAELLRWDGVVAMDGVRGGSNGAILRRFNKEDKNTAYCAYIANAFTKTRWLQLKRVIKLNNNANIKKKGNDGYEPAYKYDMIFDVIISNVNYLTKEAALDMCSDETTYAHEGGYGEVDSGLIMGKPGVTRSGQIVIVNDVGRIRPRAYTHHHRCHEGESGVGGRNEVKHLVTKLLKELWTVVNPQGILREKPHITCDNFFSVMNVAILCADQGVGMTSTLRCDCFPQGVPKYFFHGQKTTPKDNRAKVVKFLQPIVATKNIDNGVLQLTSFQSTS